MLKSTRNAGVSQRPPPDTYSDKVVILFITSYSSDSNLQSMDESSVYFCLFNKMLLFALLITATLNFISLWLVVMDSASWTGVSCMESLRQCLLRSFLVGCFLFVLFSYMMTLYSFPASPLL